MSVSSSSTDPIQTTIDLLSGYSGWSLDAPEVSHYSDISQQDKESQNDPAIYVWSPVDGTMEGLGAKRTKTIDLDTIECSIWVLASHDGTGFSNCKTYYDDTISFLEDYVTDNSNQTTFHHIRPMSGTDARQERVARRTDHYIMTVRAEFENLRDAGT